MNNKVDIRVEFDSTRIEPRVIIQTAEATELVENLIYAIEKYVDSEFPQIAVEDKDSIVMLNQWGIFRLHTENHKVTVHTADGQYTACASLQDVEKKLDPDCFVRISRFEVINLKKAVRFDFSTIGTIKVIFEDESETWVARRYVNTIRELLSRGPARKGVRS